MEENKKRERERERERERRYMRVLRVDSCPLLKKQKKWIFVLIRLISTSF